MSKLTLQLMEDALGAAEDNLCRARAAFRGKSPEQMQEQYGESGQTCQQIQDGYQTRFNEIEMEIEILRGRDGKG